MKKSDKEALILYAGVTAHKHKIDQARSIIESAFKALSPDSWYVAFSGGKDSGVVFDLVQKVNNNVLGIWSDDEFYLPETADYMRRMEKSGAKIRQIQEKAVHTKWFTAHADGETQIVAGEYGGIFLGLRAQENNSRRLYLRKYGRLHQTPVKWLCNPIAWWKTEDVWAYICSRGLDYNKAYDRLSEIGVPLERQRIGPYAVDGALGYGQLAILKKGWPEEYRRFTDRYPQACHYV